MRKAHKVLLLLLLLLLVVSLLARSHAQVKHAPTVEQCRADQRLWLDRLETSTVILPDYETLTGWFHKMFECKSVDPENRRLYHNVMGEVDADQVVRLEQFLRRHGLYDQFVAEDKVGNR